MSLRKKFSLYREYYYSAHKRRIEFYSWKWRLFVILLASLLVLSVNDYLQAKYVGTIALEAKPDGSVEATSYTMADKLFNWFMTGVLFGIVALAVLYEVEFMLGLRKLISSMEKQAERGVGRMVGGMRQRKTVKQRKK